MKKLTEDQIVEIEQQHNVYVDRETQQFNVGGGYDAEYGWDHLPEEWIEEVTCDFILMDNTANSGCCYIDESGENCALEENAKRFETREDAQEYIDSVDGKEWAYISTIEKNV